MKENRWSVTPLEGLGKAIEEKRREMPRHGARDSHKRKGRGPFSRLREDIPPSQQFQEAMADVREISEYRELSAKCSPACPPSGPRRPRERTVEELRDLVHGKSRITLSDTDEYIEWTRKGVPAGLARRLHDGGLSVQDSLDLHGFTVAEAQEEFLRFVQESKRKGLRCIKIIHGRGLRSPGGPVLKEAMQRWLRAHALAYATARHMDGGLGATYVLLRR